MTVLAFRYDDSFAGILSAVYDAYTQKRFPDILLGGADTPPLTVTATHTVRTAPDKADRVFAGLARRLSRQGKNMFPLAFLSEAHGVGTLLFRCMRAVFDTRISPEGDFTDNDMLALDKLARAVHAESHLLTGFARFQKTAQGVYFAALGPRYNVLALLLPHFRERFSGQPWLIYDARRGFGYLHENGRIADVTLDGALLQDGRLPDHLLDGEETAFRALWQEYFAAATIDARRNPRLQARCLPRRYWPYMPEFAALQGRYP